MVIGPSDCPIRKTILFIDIMVALSPLVAKPASKVCIVGINKPCAAPYKITPAITMI